MRWVQPCTDSAFNFYIIERVYRNRECGTAITRFSIHVPASTREFTLTSLDPNTEYDIRVTALTSALSESLFSTITTKVAGSKCLLRID